jgi:ATP-dependent DNA helicase DinG
MNKLVAVFDTETTGLTLHPGAHLNKQPRIIEFGCAILSAKDGSVVETANILIHPGVEVSAEITKITGITNEDLVGAPSFAEVLPQIRRLFAQCAGVTAHNLPFDKALMFFELARLEVEDFPWPEKETCTVGLYKELWGRNVKLTELYEAVTGAKLAQTHRAIDDVMALVEIIQKEQIWAYLA